MKIVRVAGFIIGLLALIYYGYQLLGKPNGSKYKVDSNHGVYYKGDGVSEDDAKKVGSYLTEQGLFTTDNKADVQISGEKNSKEIKIKYIAEKDSVNSELESALLLLSKDLGARFFPNKDIRVIIVDKNLDDIKDLGIATSAQPAANNPGVNQTGDEK